MSKPIESYFNSTASVRFKLVAPETRRETQFHADCINGTAPSLVRARQLFSSNPRKDDLSQLLLRLLHQPLPAQPFGPKSQPDTQKKPRHFRQLRALPSRNRKSYLLVFDHNLKEIIRLTKPIKPSFQAPNFIEEFLPATSPNIILTFSDRLQRRTSRKGIAIGKGGLS
jgi:hypothetical protein